MGCCPLPSAGEEPQTHRLCPMPQFPPPPGLTHAWRTRGTGPGLGTWVGAEMRPSLFWVPAGGLPAPSTRHPAPKGAAPALGAPPSPSTSGDIGAKPRVGAGPFGWRVGSILGVQRKLSPGGGRVSPAPGHAAGGGYSESQQICHPWSPPNQDQHPKSCPVLF